ncbi:hypothetical protein GCM10023100_37530 [Actinocorallia cavernae]|uniref:Uncharacterized protein n=2 Tax=Actinomycetes TaxID=1760 RepID=A0ABP8SS82_9ACTN
MQRLTTSPHIESSGARMSLEPEGGPLMAYLLIASPFLGGHLLLRPGKRAGARIRHEKPRSRHRLKQLSDHSRTPH